MRRFAWPLAMPPMLAGVLAAHALAFRLTVPAPERARVLADTGHAWFHYVPFVLGAGAAVLVLALVRSVAAAPHASPVVWPFALFPPLALLLQEQAERGRLALDTTIVAGVLLAVPLGLVAYALLRAVLHVSNTCALALGEQPLRRPAASGLLVLAETLLPPALATAPLGARGPPSRARS